MPQELAFASQRRLDPAAQAAGLERNDPNPPLRAVGFFWSSRLPTDDRAALLAQYRKYIYPVPTDDIERDYLATGKRLIGDPGACFFALWPEGRAAKGGLRVLVPGCGSQQAAILAACNRRAKITGIDLSDASIEYERLLKSRHGLGNLYLETGDFREHLAPEPYDLICCSGVIHHLADPEAALERLGTMLAPGGVLYLAVYGKHARQALDPFKRAIRAIGCRQDSDGAARLRDLLPKIPPWHPARQFCEAFGDTREDAELLDLFLHSQECFFDVPELLALIRGANLRVKNWAYPERYAAGYYCPDLMFSGVLDRRFGIEQQWDFADIMGHSYQMHHVYLQRLGNGVASPAYGEMDAGSAYYRISPESRWSVDESSMATLSVRGWSTSLPLPGIEEVPRKSGTRVSDVGLFRENQTLAIHLFRTGLIELSQVPFLPLQRPSSAVG